MLRWVNRRRHCNGSHGAARLLHLARRARRPRLSSCTARRPRVPRCRPHWCCTWRTPVLPPRSTRIDKHAKRDGRTVTITRHILDMGWYFLNPKYTAFDVTKPAILVYAKRASRWQLVAFEWVPLEKPTKGQAPGDLRILRRGMPLQGRHVRLRRRRGGLRGEEP